MYTDKDIRITATTFIILMSALIGIFCNSSEAAEYDPSLPGIGPAHIEQEIRDSYERGGDVSEYEKYAYLDIMELALCAEVLSWPPERSESELVHMSLESTSWGIVFADIFVLDPDSFGMHLENVYASLTDEDKALIAATLATLTMPYQCMETFPG